MTTVLPGRDDKNIKGLASNKISSHLNEGMAYKAYTTKRRTIVASPDSGNQDKFKSPENFKSEFSKNQKSSDNSSILSEQSIDKFQKNMRENYDDNYSKYPKYKSFSPTYAEVSLPNGSTYRLDDETDNYSNDNYSVTSSNYSRSSKNRYENDEVRSVRSARSRKNSHTDSYYNGSNKRESKRESKRKESRHSRRSRRDSLSTVSEYDSEESYDSDLEDREQRRREKREEKIRRDEIMNLILQDYYERKKKEKENEEKERESSKKTSETSKASPGSFQIPKNEENKSKIPNYEELSNEDKLKVKNKFIDLFQTLKNSYPDWQIQPPDFDNLPLKIIHERYEEVVRTICIYQTAMKWKVYLIIIIAGIEYYGYNVHQYTFLKGLLKQQIKSIHKYNNYLIEIAEMFYSTDDSGEEWPLWVRFLGTVLSSLTSFCGISGLSKAVNFDAPDFAFEQADKFMSPPEGTAKLRTDGISDLPTPPTGFQNPDTVVGIIGNMFGTFTGNHSNQKKPSNSSNDQVPQATAKPLDDDYENVEF